MEKRVYCKDVGNFHLIKKKFKSDSKDLKELDRKKKILAKTFEVDWDDLEKIKFII